MKPAAEIQSEKDPSLAELVSTLVSYGADRGSFVRRAAPTRTPGVCVMLLSSQAIREVGPYLKDFASRLEANAKRFVIIDKDTPYRRFFEMMEALKYQWMWGHICVRGEDGLVFTTIGAHVTDAFAAELTKRGVITNLA
jgi:hypothetical protein